MKYLYISILVGIGATLFTDLWNLFLKRGFKIQSLNFCLLGRWILYMPNGTFSHKNIKATPSKPMECIIGWVTHYSIGVMLTFLFIVAVSGNWTIRPTLLPAILYGIGTVVFPLFILQPSLGLGFASSKTPSPIMSRIKSLMTHIMFGIGIWLSAIAMKYLLQ